MSIHKYLACFILITLLITAVCHAEDAEEMREKGIAALKESQANPRAIVEAARAFVKASELYVTAGNEEKAIEMNSFLYWCKKKMAMEDIDAFIKGGETSVSTKLNAIEKLAPKADEAQAYLDRAEQFASKNPAEHLLIAIRFYEVADRFKGSDASMKALDRSLKEQLQDKSSGAKSTLPPTAIRIPDNAPASVGSRAVPSADDIKQAEKLVKDLLKDEYAKTDPAGRLALATKLLQQADENKGDPASEYVLLHEARDYAVMGGDAIQATDAQKRLRDSFKIDFAAMLIDLRKLEAASRSADSAAALATLLSLGADDALAVDNYDQAVRYNSRAEDLLPLIKNAALKDHLKTEVARVLALKQASTAALAAQKTLASKPEDPEANLAIGRFALQKGEFEKAFAMLAKGSDKALAGIAKRELTPAAEAPEQAKLGDDWFDLAAKESNTFVKKAMQERAGVWYGNALPALTGLGKLKVEGRMKTLAPSQKANSPLKLAGCQGKLYVSCGDKVDVVFNNKIIGKSSQWGPLTPIPVSLPNGDAIYFIAKGDNKHSYGVSWVFISNDGKLFMVSDQQNTLGINGSITKDSKFAESTTGPFWVNHSLMDRLDKDLVTSIVEAKSVLVKPEQGADEPKSATYRWIFNANDLIPARNAAQKEEPTNLANPKKSDSKELVIDLSGGIKMEFIPIPPGTFQMGSPNSEKGHSDEERLHEVRLSKPFYMSKYPITQEQYEIITGSNPSNFPGARNPVEKVSYSDAQAFCIKLNEKSQVKSKFPAGFVVQLPTEAQWEYACRAGTKTSYFSGESETDLNSFAWFNTNSEGKTHPVGEKKTNAWGLYDMNGNVFCWCRDWMAPYPSGAQVDPQGPANGKNRVLRGGSWYWDTGWCRSAHRNQNEPGVRGIDYGFRVVIAAATNVP